MQPQILLSSQDKRAKRAPIVSGPQPVCQGCKTQFSRYTCPKCNFHYCSLPCFRSTQHEGCSEAFDRQSLMEDIQAARDKTGEEKRAMMDMLRNFEEESARREEQGGESEGEGEEEREELQRKLEGLDLDALSPDDLLALLSPAQREAFDTTLQDPFKVTALVSEEFEGDKPWWEVREESSDAEDEDAELEEFGRPPLVDGSRLPPLRLDAEGKVMVDAKLVYNIVAVLFAYAYTLRTFSLDSFASLPPRSTERSTMADMMAQLVPFLVEKSMLVFDDPSSAVEHVVAREEADRITPALLALLLRDVDHLLRPLPVALVASPDAAPSLASHLFVNPLAGLSDLHDLFTSLSIPASAPATAASPLIARPSPSTSRPTGRFAGAAQKLLFYIAFLAHPRSPVDSQLLGSVAAKLGREAERREKEAREAEEAVRIRREEREAERRQGREEEGGGAVGKIVEIE